MIVLAQYFIHVYVHMHTYSCMQKLGHPLCKRKFLLITFTKCIALLLFYKYLSAMYVSTNFLTNYAPCLNSCKLVPPHRYNSMVVGGSNYTEIIWYKQQILVAYSKESAQTMILKTREV